MSRRRYSFDSDPARASLSTPPASLTKTFPKLHPVITAVPLPPIAINNLLLLPPNRSTTSTTRARQSRLVHTTHATPPGQPPPPDLPQTLDPSAPPTLALTQNRLFRQIREDRRNSRIRDRPSAAPTAAISTAGAAYATRDLGDAPPPPPPPHRELREPNHIAAFIQAPRSNITPGADNFSEAASGGISGLAVNVADRNARLSGLEAMRGQPENAAHPEAYQRAPTQPSPYDEPQDYGYDHAYDPPVGYSNENYNHSANNLAPGGPYPSGRATPSRSTNSYASDPFQDHHAMYNSRHDPNLGQFNPNDIADDGDDGLNYGRSARNSMLSLGNSSGRGTNSAAAAAGGAAGGAAAGAAMGGLMGGRARDGPNYDPVYNASASPPEGGTTELADRGEKSAAAAKAASKKRWRWIIIGLIGLVVIGAILGGVLGGVLSQNSKNQKSEGESAADDTKKNGDLDINSPEIQALLNNPDYHKVFPGVDYTPLNVQYPDCLGNPPSQNNITRDVAVLSQLTNTIRLYGTDCNQTEMTIHAVNQLKMEDDIKIWLGVWQDNNKTTNSRQLSQMWDIFDQYGSKPFKGVIVANEILFREQMTITQLGSLLDSVRKNLTEHGWSLPVATSDLGDDWTPELAKVSDYIMANIHPFFAGVNAKEAAGWAYSFWQNQNSAYFKSDKQKNIISEIGWPGKGGTDCGSDKVTDCPNGSVAGIDELNTLMDGWVCQALTNGTEYFWFEMFDEPWKISFNEPGKEWEDQWGLMDVNRKLKPGVKIPDCGGKTV